MIRICKKVIPCFIAMLAIVLIAKQAIYRPQNHTYDIVILGDSIVANYNGEDGIARLLEIGLEKSVFNGAFGGSTVVAYNEKLYNTNNYQSLCFSQLSDSIVAKDFTIQRSTINQIIALDYYDERLIELSNVDFEQVEILIVEGLVNDFTLQIDPKIVESEYRNAISNLQKKYPHLQIVLSSAVYCYLLDENKHIRYCDSKEDWHYTIDQYVEVQKKISEELNLVYVEQYHDSVIHKETADVYLEDGLHLNAEGRKVISQNIIDAIKDSKMSEED